MLPCCLMVSRQLTSSRFCVLLLIGPESRPRSHAATDLAGIRTESVSQAFKQPARNIISAWLLRTAIALLLTPLITPRSRPGSPSGLRLIPLTSTGITLPLAHTTRVLVSLGPTTSRRPFSTAMSVHSCTGGVLPTPP